MAVAETPSGLRAAGGPTLGTGAGEAADVEKSRFDDACGCCAPPDGIARATGVMIPALPSDAA
eukprot:11873764-Heterocapsa_arctica.AAC.1